MKVFTDKNVIKRITIAILIVMMFSFMSPTVSQADFGGKLFEPISQLLCGVADLVIMGLQKIFVGDGDIYYGGISEIESSTYHIKYSPGIIFSGGIPALDVNFIDPNFQGDESFYPTKETGTWEKVNDYSLDDKNDLDELAKIGFDKNVQQPRYAVTDGERYAWIIQVNSENRHAIYEWTDPATKVRYTLINTTSSTFELDNLGDSLMSLVDRIGQMSVDLFQKLFRNRMDII